MRKMSEFAEPLSFSLGLSLSRGALAILFGRRKLMSFTGLDCRSVTRSSSAGRGSRMSVGKNLYCERRGFRIFFLTIKDRNTY